MDGVLANDVEASSLQQLVAHLTRGARLLDARAERLGRSGIVHRQWAAHLREDARALELLALRDEWPSD